MVTAQYAAPADFLLAVMMALDVAKQTSKPIGKLALCTTVCGHAFCSSSDKDWTEHDSNGISAGMTAPFLVKRKTKPVCLSL